MKKPYRQGTWFAVPIDGGSAFVLGVVARCNRSIRILPFFFLDRIFHGQPPALEDAIGLEATDASWIANTGGQGMIEGEWLVLGELGDWSVDDWPLPVFRHEYEGKYQRVVFADGPFKRPHVEEISQQEWATMPDCSGPAPWEHYTEFGWRTIHLNLSERVTDHPESSAGSTSVR